MGLTNNYGWNVSVCCVCEAVMEEEEEEEMDWLYFTDERMYGEIKADVHTVRAKMYFQQVWSGGWVRTWEGRV